MSYEEQINSYYEKTGLIRHSDTLVVMKNTPTDFLNKGVIDLPIALPISIITKSQNGKNSDHTISNKNIKRLDKGIKNAIAYVIDNYRNALGIITNISQNNKQVCVFVKPNVTFDNDRVNKITSIHLRENIYNYLDNISDGTLLVKNKKELLSLCREIDNLDRFQMENKLNVVILPQNNNNVNNKIQYQGRGNGYRGYSMSNNAVAAYEDGEKPLSKWSKSDIILAVAEIDINKA